MNHENARQQSEPVPTIDRVATGPDRIPLPPRYSWWQEQLASVFFRASRDAPVVLFVDDDELRRLVPDSDHPGLDLASAVTEIVQPQLGADMFGAVSALERVWNRGSRSGPPPTLPVLALSVLAATHMHTDPVWRATNYYRRLAEALLPSASNGVIGQVTTVLRGHAFLPVADMWVQLHRWIEESNGALGRSTIREHPRLKRIGCPLSQAMIRRADRAALTRFFARLGLESDDLPSPRALREYLRIWVSRPRGFSDAFLDALNDADLQPLLNDVVMGLASAWDGRVITGEGLVRLESAIVLNLKRWTARWAVRSAPNQKEDTLRGSIAGSPVEISVEIDPYSSLCRCRGFPETTGPAVREGFRLRGNKYIAELPSTKIVVLREDPDANGWISKRSINPYRDHLIAAASDYADVVQRILKRAADDGWRPLRQSPTRPLLSGFVLFSGVTFSDAAALSQVLSFAPGLVRSAIRPDLATRARLVNGLPIARQLGRNHFLLGGEPDLLFPVGEQERSVQATLDGIAQQPPFRATGFPIGLRGLGLEAGMHVIEAEHDTLRFALLPAAPAEGEVQGTGRLGWDESGTLGAGHANPAVCGAAIAGVDPLAPVLARRGATRVWMIHSDGQFSAVAEPPPVGGVLGRVAGFAAYYCEIVAPDTAVWLVEERGRNWRVRRIGTAAPSFVRLDDCSQSLWPAVAGHGPARDPLWSAYVRAWEDARGR